MAKKFCVCIKYRVDVDSYSRFFVCVWDLSRRRWREPRGLSLKELTACVRL